MDDKISTPSREMQVQMNKGELRWHDARELTIEGKGWEDTDSFYGRLPAKARSIVNERHWKLSQSPSGISIHFTTNAPSLSVKWDAVKDVAGMTGLDLYVRHEGQWRWLSVATATQTLNVKELFTDLPAQSREYMLYLPMFHPTQHVETVSRHHLRSRRRDPVHVGQCFSTEHPLRMVHVRPGPA